MLLRPALVFCKYFRYGPTVCAPFSSKKIINIKACCTNSLWLLLNLQLEVNTVCSSYFCHDQRLCKTIKFVVIIARGNWVIYRNSIVRVECTNVLEKFSCSNSVADQIELCIESTFGFLKFAAN